MTQAIVNGLRIDVLERGAGTPVVMLHAALADRRSVDSQARLLAARHRVLSFSARGAWPGLGVTDVGVLRHAGDLASLLEQACLEPAHLVGVGNGAHVALVTARDRPELVRSLVLAEPLILSLYEGASRAELAQRIFDEDAEAAAAFADHTREGIIPATEAFMRGDGVVAARGLMRAVMGESFARLPPERLLQMDQNAESLRESLLGRPEPVTPAQAAAIRAPALVLACGGSNAFFKHLARKLAAALPEAAYDEFGSAAAWGNELEPEAFVQRVERFFISVDTRVQARRVAVRSDTGERAVRP